MRIHTPVRYRRDGEWRLGHIRTMLADYPGYYAVFLIQDIGSKEEMVVDSRDVILV